MIEVVVNAEQLRKALKEIEIAESHNIMHCDAIFKLSKVGDSLDDCRIEFGKHLVVKADPVDPRKNWGRYDHYLDHKYENGDLIPLE